MFVFVDGDFYIPAVRNGQVEKHPSTQTQMLLFRNYNRDHLQFVSQILKKQIKYPEPSSRGNPQYFFAIDFDGAPDLQNLNVPIYSMVDHLLSKDQAARSGMER